MERRIVFFCGTYTTRLHHTKGRGSGLEVLRLSTGDWSITKLHDTLPVKNSAYLCIHPDGNLLYCINETNEFEGNEEGYFSVFNIDKESLELKELQRKGTRGIGPSYISIDKKGRFLFIANYAAGNAVVFPLDEDGLACEASEVVVHSGCSDNWTRQEGPHPHSIMSGPDGRFVYVPDLGIDKLVVYEMEEDSGKLKVREDLNVTTDPGTGPRHLVFHPSGNWAYLVLEMSSQIIAYKYENGKLIECGSYRTLPEEVLNFNLCSEIKISPNGKNLYVSNRGPDSISVYSIDPTDGSLEMIQNVSTLGRIPRSFDIDPNGRVLIAGNQESDTIICYGIDAEDGILTRIGGLTGQASPCAIRIARQNEK